MVSCWRLGSQRELRVTFPAAVSATPGRAQTGLCQRPGALCTVFASKTRALTLAKFTEQLLASR
jgi:hypothetical protein